MSFINQAILYGLAAIAIPIILHLLNRRSAKKIEWGAMQFLLDSVESRKRRIQLEEALLLAARCLLLGLIALAVARPLQEPGGRIPYVVVIPAFLVALVCLSTGIILRENKKLLASLLLLGLGLLAFCGAAIWYEQTWNLKRYGDAGQKDIVLIIDGSTSMQLKQNGTSNFDRAIMDAKEVVDKSAGGNAFSVILGGPTPQVRVGDPLVNKNDLELALNSLKPVRGKMNGFAALTTALTALNRGANASKEIIVFTDGQAIGWDLDDRASWEALSGSAKHLKSKPPVLFRQYQLPKQFRNLSASQLKLSRDTVGTDRAVGIELTLENTGTEAITPSVVELALDFGAGTDPAKQGPGQPVLLKETGLSQLQPGGRETVRFSYKFTDPGSVVARARVQIQDDLSTDNETEMAVNVAARLGVLIVEGNPNADVLKRSATFTALALAPLKQLAMTPADQNDKSKIKPGVLLDPEVKAMSQIPSVASFQGYDVVILCDVPKLPDSTARRLAAWVQSGGGLLIAPGAQADSAFYNGWKTADGSSLLPAKFASQTIVQPGKDPMGLALNTFTYSALKLAADAKQSDLGSTVLGRFWKLEPDSSDTKNAFVGGRLANGDPFLSVRRVGFGAVMLCAASFDANAGNLGTRQAFLPMVHQLVYNLANPEGQPLNREPAQQINVSLGGSIAEGGLKAEYYRGRSFSGAPVVRIDSKSEANFNERPPPPGVGRENFSVRWTGAVTPRFTDEYIFDVQGAEQIAVWLDGRKILDQRGDAHVSLQAGKLYPLRIEFEQTNGNNGYQLFWRTSKGEYQQREVIPTDALMPFPPGAEEQEAQVGMMEALGPDNATRHVPLYFTRGGLVARMSGDIIPGVYHFNVPKDRQKEYQRLMSRDGTIPFTIADDGSESRLTQFTDRDFEFVKSHFEWLRPKDVADITNILAGKAFGEELWRYLAVAALFILLAEIALTRWIALNRRQGEEVVIDFEHKFQAPKQFQEQLERIQRSTV